MTLRIEPTTDMHLVRELLEEYARATHVDLSFQNFDHELDTLPYEYDPILLAWSDEQAAGCVALRRIDAATCEMKRLWQLTSTNVISRLANVTPSGQSAIVTVPAQSITLLVFPRGASKRRAVAVESGRPGRSERASRAVTHS